MKRKVISAVLSLVMLSSLLTGCGGSKEGKNPKSDGAGGSEEIVNIVWQYPSAGNLGSGFQDVEDALNEMLEKDIGVHVTFEPCSLMDSQKEASLMVSAGEQLISA